MDTITHALIGASLAHASQPRKVSGHHLKLSHRISLGALAAAFPDIDYATYLIDPLSFISDWHRAETHSFLLLPFWAILLALLFTYITHQKTYLKEAFIICSLSLGSHIFADLITSWGTQIYAPVIDTRYAIGTTFVIDPYFSAIIILGLLIGLIRRNPVATRTGIACLLLYISFQATLKMQASNIARQQVVINNWNASDIYTLPQPFSPFHWKIVIASGEHYYMSYLNLMGRTHYPFLPEAIAILIQHYRPENSLNWQRFNRYGNITESKHIQSAWNHSAFSRYRLFAQLPAYYTSSQTTNEKCNWFVDLRYTLPELKPSFVYGICQNLNDISNWTVKSY